MALDRLASVPLFHSEFGFAARMLLSIVFRKRLLPADTMWEDLHDGQRLAASALWRLAYGCNCTPGPDVARAVESALPREGCPGALVDCLLVHGLDTLFLGPVAPNALPVASRIALSTRLVGEAGALSQVCGEVDRIARAVHGEAQYPYRQPLRLAELARRQVRLMAGPHVMALTDSPVLQPQVRQLLLYER